jgi:glycosyltransferase involved in cell wall biosynthesis
LIVSHDYGWFYNGIGSGQLSRSSGVPYLSELHHVPGHPVPGDLRERFDKFIAKLYVAYAKNKARSFRVVNSTEMPELLRSWNVPDEKILVLPSLYIDLDVFKPAVTPETYEQDVVYVGRMVNNKGLDRIVDALAMLKRRSQPHRALFVGKGPMVAKLHQLVDSAGLRDSTRFVEWVDTPDDLASIYRRSRLIVCASTCEGGPRVTVEAMACGTPVVSTPVGVMTELLHAGTAGFLCDFSARDLCDKMQRILADNDLRNELAAGAHGDAQRFERKAALGVYAQGLIDLVAPAQEIVPS